MTTLDKLKEEIAGFLPLPWVSRILNPQQLQYSINALVLVGSTIP